MRDDCGILEALLSDGRFLLSLTGFILAFSGGFTLRRRHPDHQRSPCDAGRKEAL
jgi:hypothetical protein